MFEGAKWGVGSVVVGFRVFEAPRFSVLRYQNTNFQGFWEFWTENWGAPKTQNPTTMDPTPNFARNCHNRLSEITLGELCLGRLRNFGVVVWSPTVFCWHASKNRFAQWPFCHCAKRFPKNYFWPDHHCAKVA